MKVSIIGGGAAGFFTAINLARLQPSWQVEVLEKTSKLLSKVKISGGGRCNVTHNCFQPKELSGFYPRGQKKLISVFRHFQPENTIEWFAKRGVSIKAEADNRMFPITDNSQTIIDTFLKEAQKHKVNVRTKCGLRSIGQRADQKWELHLENGDTEITDKVVIATGSQPSAFKIMEKLGLKMVRQVPSLFTFNIKDPRLKDLMGLSFPWVEIKIAGTKLSAQGPLLITHWGLSGPAILKLSAWGARELEDRNYNFEILVNFLAENQEKTRASIQALRETEGKKLASNVSIEGIPKRYWLTLCDLAEIQATQTFGEISKKQMNKLIEEVSQGKFLAKGKSTFKEEFVTAGGVDLSEIDFNTMQAKRFPNLYLAGEILDIDAVTGGFNFQACWSTAWLIANNISG